MKPLWLKKYSIKAKYNQRTINKLMNEATWYYYGFDKLHGENGTGEFCDTLKGEAMIKLIADELNEVVGKLAKGINEDQFKLQEDSSEFHKLMLPLKSPNHILWRHHGVREFLRKYTQHKECFERNIGGFSKRINKGIKKFLPKASVSFKTKTIDNTK
jgi:hypothetical protein